MEKEMNRLALKKQDQKIACTITLSSDLGFLQPLSSLPSNRSVLLESPTVFCCGEPIDDQFFH
jgi:hypothetical protein